MQEASGTLLYEKYIELVRLKTGYYLACGMVGGAVAYGNSMAQ